jgi:NADP-dependent 3-hydroxy acid dehydrogenase YdfG
MSEIKNKVVVITGASSGLGEAIAIDADAIARAIAFAIEQPSDVDVNEMIIRPTKQDL